MCLFLEPRIPQRTHPGRTRTRSLGPGASSSSIALTWLQLLAGQHQSLDQRRGDQLRHCVRAETLSSDEGLGFPETVRLLREQQFLQNGGGFLAADLTEGTLQLLDARQTFEQSSDGVRRDPELFPTFGYLGELVEAEDLFAVAVSMATLIHQLLQLGSNFVVGEGEHGEGEQAADGGGCRDKTAVSREEFLRAAPQNLSCCQRL